MIVLTSQERDRFVAYLEETMENDKGLIKQMEDKNIPVGFIKTMKIQIRAMRVVAHMLRRTTFLPAKSL
jgi:hypothetical protein